METEDRTSGFKHALARFGRTLKSIDVRQTIVDHPFAAIGVAAAAGALLGGARPMPERGRISSAVISTLGLIAFKLVRDTAIRELGMAAKNIVFAPREAAEGIPNPPSGIRYTPAL